MAGFLPLSPSEAHLGGLEHRDVEEMRSRWLEHGAPWRDDVLSATAWNRARVRTGQSSGAAAPGRGQSLAAASPRGGTLATILGILLERTGAVESLRALTGSEGHQRIGSDRAIDMLVSGIIPLALAFADHSGDLDLADAVSSQWDRLPAPSPNAVTRRALARLPIGHL